MCEPNMKMPLSPSPSPSTSQVQLHPSTPEIPSRCSSNLMKRMRGDTCYRCHQQGHWSWYCPLKSLNTKPLSPSPKHDSPISHNMIRCRCGHGFCKVKTSHSDRNWGKKYYACPIKKGARCKEFVKWCDDPIYESDLQPPPFKYPECECGVGVCRRVKDTETPDAVKYYFACPVKQDHGSCGYRVSEDELLNGKNIVPIQKSRQRTLHDFWEGCQNDKFDNDQGDELGKGDDLLVQTKRMKIRDNSENPLSTAGSEIPDEDDAGAANLKHVGFPEFEVTDDDLEFMNSVSWETIEAEAFLLSRLSTPSRIRWQQNKSMENSLTMEEHNKLLEEEKMRFAQLQDDYVKTQALLEASNQYRQLLCEQVSNLTALLHEKQNQLKCCELETLKIETHLGDIKRSMFEADKTLKERAEQTEVARKQSEERQAKQITATTSLEKAKLELEN